MALLFVFGVMNLAWVACLAVVVLIEKVVPGGQRIGWLAGVAVLAVGVAVVLGLLTVALLGPRDRSIDSLARITPCVCDRKTTPTATVQDECGCLIERERAGPE